MEKRSKLEMIKKSTGWRIAFWAILIVAAALLTWLVIAQVNKYKQEKILKDAEKKALEDAAANQNTNTGNNSQNNNTGANNSPGRPSAPPGAVLNDDMPLKIGSIGPNVKALQLLLNQISGPGKPVTNQRGLFDDQTYKAVLSQAGTKFYPVTLENFQKINTLAASAQAQTSYMPTANFTGNERSSSGCSKIFNDYSIKYNQLTHYQNITPPENRNMEYVHQMEHDLAALWQQFLSCSHVGKKTGIYK